MNVNGRQVYYFTFENNNTSGGVGGLLPYSRLKTSPGHSYAQGDAKVLAMHKKHFVELEHMNPDFIQRLIGYMTERARFFAVQQLQHEKVSALGNLAAGIAHELNNPAAAIKGISDELTSRLARNYELTENLIKCNMQEGQIRKVRELVEKKEGEQPTHKKQSALARMDAEEAMGEWLEDAGIRNKMAAETLAEFGFTTDELETLKKDCGEVPFRCVIPWLENILSSHKIIKDLAEASTRISNLVASIKTHVHMDRANDMQPTNIQQGIESTLTLLGFKIRDKNIEVTKNYCKDNPDIPAYVGELNQVWTNLIDNAIFAVDKDGKLTIETNCDQKNITVSIIDNGKGIPKEIISRIFDPFFTTKKVGEGTGIGLDIVNRIVKRHHGEISVESIPGRTRFAVSIPIVQKII
jgi:signal transduction histidine kinase